MVHEVGIESGLKATEVTLVRFDLWMCLQVRLEAVLEHEYCGTDRTGERSRPLGVLLHHMVLALRLGEEAMSAVLAEDSLLLEMLPFLVVQESVPTAALIVAGIAVEHLVAVDLAVHPQVYRTLEGHATVLAEVVTVFLVDRQVAVQAVRVAEGQRTLVALVGTLLRMASEVAAEVGVASNDDLPTHATGELSGHLFKVVSALHVAVQEVARMAAEVADTAAIDAAGVHFLLH